MRFAVRCFCKCCALRNACQLSHLLPFFFFLLHFACFGMVRVVYGGGLAGGGGPDTGGYDWLAGWLRLFVWSTCGGGGGWSLAFPFPYFSECLACCRNISLYQGKEGSSRAVVRVSCWCYSTHNSHFLCVVVTSDWSFVGPSVGRPSVRSAVGRSVVGGRVCMCVCFRVFL